eukprot:355040-Chlamydomonas_euryale.AAC.19
MLRGGGLLGRRDFLAVQSGCTCRKARVWLHYAARSRNLVPRRPGAQAWRLRADLPEAGPSAIHASVP